MDKTDKMGYLQGFPPVLHSALQGLRPSVHLQNFHCLWLKRNTDGWAQRPRLGRSGRIWEVMSRTQKPADLYIEYSAGSASEHPVWKSILALQHSKSFQMICQLLQLSKTWRQIICIPASMAGKCPNPKIKNPWVASSSSSFGFPHIQDLSHQRNAGITEPPPRSRWHAIRKHL